MAAAKRLGIGSAETLRKWVRQAEIDAGNRPGVTGQESAGWWSLGHRYANACCTSFTSNEVNVTGSSVPVLPPGAKEKSMKLENIHEPSNQAKD